MPAMRTPWWMTVIIVLSVLPVAIWPFIMTLLPTDALPDALVWLYPAYVLCAGICAWICYPQRPAVAWILVALLWLSHLGIFCLIA